MPSEPTNAVLAAKIDASVQLNRSEHKAMYSIISEIKAKVETHEGRIQKVELFVGKTTLKLAAAGIVVVAVIYKVIDYVWEKIA